MKVPPPPRRSTRFTPQSSQGESSYDVDALTPVAGESLGQGSAGSVQEQHAAEEQPIGEPLKKAPVPAPEVAPRKQRSPREASASKRFSTSFFRGGFAGRLLNKPVGDEEAVEALGRRREDEEAEVLQLSLRRRTFFRSRLQKVFVAVFSALVIAGLSWMVFFSDVFALKDEQITIVGADETIVQSAKVRETLIPWHGYPLLRLSVHSMQDAILTIPTVKSVDVTRNWPGGVDVTIEARTVALSEKSDAGWNHIDSEGVVLLSGQADRAPGTPVVNLVVDESRRKMTAEELFAVWSALDGDLKGNVDSIRHDGLNITVYLTGDKQIRWGDAENSELKARVARTLMEQRPARVYDVSSPTHPVIS